MLVGSTEYWSNRFSKLDSEFPAWGNCFKRLDPGYLPWLAEVMGNSPITAPQPDDVFKPFSDLTPGQVRVVILGQDPYPTPGNACGRAFAISPSVKTVPVSLRNLLKTSPDSTADQTLDSWVSQGVLLINSSPLLYPGSGTPRHPWRHFTDTVLRFLAESCDPVFVFMGKTAQSHIDAVSHSSKIVTSAHPAARGGQFQSQPPFTSINKLLSSPIMW